MHAYSQLSAARMGQSQPLLLHDQSDASADTICSALAYGVSSCSTSSGVFQIHSCFVVLVVLYMVKVVNQHRALNDLNVYEHSFDEMQ